MTITDKEDRDSQFKQILCVIVTYNPDIGALAENIRSVKDQVAGILVVDNSTTEKTRESIRKFCLEKKIQLLSNQFNLGIAGALNRSLDWARTHQYDSLLTMDQDSTVCDDYVRNLLSAYTKIGENKKIGILAPVHFDKKTGYLSRGYRLDRKEFVAKDIVMTSGNLLPLGVFSEIGGFDEDLFIEYVDHDFCLRLKKHGYSIYMVRDARLGHNLGDARKHYLGPYFFFSHNYLPVRRYYRARNRFVLYRRHFGKWILHDQLFALKDFIKIALVEKSKFQKLKATALGTFDGLLGRMGAFDGTTYLGPKAYKYFVEFRSEILPIMPKFSDRVLDLGCGSGETSGYFKKFGLVNWVCGVEGSHEAATLAKQKLDFILEGDIEKIEYPFPDKHFDLILALDILEHLVDPWTVVKKLRRLLKPEGKLIVSMPNVRHFSVLIPLLFLGDWRYTQQGLLDSTHLRFFTRKTVMSLFENEGFSLYKIDHTGAKKRISSLLNIITFGLLKDFMIYQYLACFELTQPATTANDPENSSDKLPESSL